MVEGLTCCGLAAQREQRRLALRLKVVGPQVPLLDVVERGSVGGKGRPFPLQLEDYHAPAPCISTITSTHICT